MLMLIPQVLNLAAIQAIQARLGTAEFIAGRLSAGALAQRVKHNQEMAIGDTEGDLLGRSILGALMQHPQFQAAALPKSISMPFLARYVPGDYYGNHVDDPVMGTAHGRYRADVAVTVFLNAPEHYQGGELTIRTPFGGQTVKGEAGSAVVYPASSLHQVAPVTAGQRLVAVAWVQSLIRDPAKRELLYELYTAKTALLETQPDTELTASIHRTYSNLLRMWAEV